MSEIVIVTAVQEKMDNRILTVREHGRVLGRVYEDEPGKWIVYPDPPVTYPTLEAIVQHLVDARG